MVLGHHHQSVCQLLPAAGRHPERGQYSHPASEFPVQRPLLPVDFQGGRSLPGPAEPGFRGYHLPEQRGHGLWRRRHCRHAHQRRREELYQRINQRVDEMMKEGLLEEVKSVYAYKHLNSLNTVGYKEIFNYLDGEWELPFAIEKIKQNSRIYSQKPNRRRIVQRIQDSTRCHRPECTADYQCTTGFGIYPCFLPCQSR